MDVIIIILIFCCCCSCCIISSAGGYYYTTTQNDIKPINNTSVPTSNNNTSVPTSNNNTSVPTSNNMSAPVSDNSAFIETTTLKPTTTISPILYPFTSHTFTNANATGQKGPTLSQIKSTYSSASWTTNSKYLNMINNDGIQLWTVPKTGNYKIRAVGASGGNAQNFGKGRDIHITTTLNQGEIIKILVGQEGAKKPNRDGGGGGGTFVVRDVQTAIIVAGGGGGRGSAGEDVNTLSNASDKTSGNNGSGDGNYIGGTGGKDGSGGGEMTSNVNFSNSAGGGGLTGNGKKSPHPNWLTSTGGLSFVNGGLGGGTGDSAAGGFGGGGGGSNGGSGGGGGGYSGGGAGGLLNNGNNWSAGGGGGSYAITTINDDGAVNIGHGKVIITMM
jgi:hypothetical protein